MTEERISEGDPRRKLDFAKSSVLKLRVSGRDKCPRNLRRQFPLEFPAVADPGHSGPGPVSGEFPRTVPNNPATGSVDPNPTIFPSEILPDNRIDACKRLDLAGRILNILVFA